MKRLALLLLALLVILADSALAQRRGGGPPQGQVQGQAPGGQQAQGGRGRGGGGGGGGRGATLQELVRRGEAGAQTATAVIQGYVIAADTGRAVPRAEVRASSPATRGTRTTSTDANGRFVLTDLPAGQWTVTVSKGGFVTQPFGQRRPFEVVPPITLADGEQRSLTFTLFRGGAINGHVYDEFGLPMTGARVQVLRAQTVDGERRLVQMGVTDQTDDRGSFRIFGLAPGDYYVTATARNGNNDEGPTRYAPSYYPGTPHAGEAQPISISLPGEEANATFTVLPVASTQVSGIVVTSEGTPAPATVNLTPLNGSGVVGPGGGLSGSSRGDGSFSISGVIPGSYMLYASTRGGRGRGGRGRGNDTPPEVAAMPITVGTEGLGGIAVTTGPGATVSGQVVGSGTIAPPMNGIRIQAQAQRGGRNVQATVAADGTFQLAGLLGSYTFDVSRIPDGWMLESIMAGGTDITDTRTVLYGAQQTSGVRVVLTDRLTEVIGGVRAGGKPVTTYTVVIFPDDPAKWAFADRFLRTARSTPEGTFSVSALPPGQYLAVAVNYLQEGEFQSPDFLQTMRKYAASFSLTPGASASLDLSLVER